MDWNQIVISLIETLPVAGAIILAWLEFKKIHKTVNSRLTELVKSEKAASLEIGRQEGRAEKKEKI